MKRSQHKKTHPPRLQWRAKVAETPPAAVVEVAETPPAAVVEVAETPPAAQAPTDPAVVLESALADVEELLGEKLEFTRELLQDSDRKSRDAVTLATSALELLTNLTKKVAHVSEHDLPRVLRAQKSTSQLVLWRNFGLIMRGLVEKLDPGHFRKYDADVQTELKQTYCKIEQMLMQELIAGDSWSKLARNLRLQSAQKEFSAEMRTLLHRIIQTCELTQNAEQRRGPVEVLSETDAALFKEMRGDAKFNSQVMSAVRHNRLQYQHAMYPAWVQQMLGGQLAASSSDMMHPMPVNHWTEPWSPEIWPWHSTASSSSGAQWVCPHPMDMMHMMKKKESLCAAYADASTASYQYCTYCISDARSFSQCFCCQCHLLPGSCGAVCQYCARSCNVKCCR